MHAYYYSWIGSVMKIGYGSMWTQVAWMDEVLDCYIYPYDHPLLKILAAAAAADVAALIGFVASY